MTIQDFRLLNFIEKYEEIRNEFDNNAPEFIELVQKKILEEFDEWEALGSKIGYFPNGDADDDSQIDYSSLKEFRDCLGIALDDTDSHDIKAIALIMYASDSEWKAELKNLDALLDENRIGGTPLNDQTLNRGTSSVEEQKFLEEVSWITSSFLDLDRTDADRFLGYPSYWRMEKNDLVIQRADELRRYARKLARVQARNDKRKRDANSNNSNRIKVLVKSSKDAASATKRSFQIRNGGAQELNIPGYHSRPMRSTRKSGRKLEEHLKALSKSIVEPVAASENVYILEDQNLNVRSEKPGRIYEKLSLNPRQVKLVIVSSGESKSSNRRIGPDGEEVVTIPSGLSADLWERVSTERRRSSSKVVILASEQPEALKFDSTRKLLESRAGKSLGQITRPRKASGFQAPVVIIADRSTE